MVSSCFPGPIRGMNIVVGAKHEGMNPLLAFRVFAIVMFRVMAKVGDMATLWNEDELSPAGVAEKGRLPGHAGLR